MLDNFGRLLVEDLASLESSELLDDLREGLTALSGQVVPLFKVLSLVFGNTLHEDDARVDQSFEHEENVS